MIGRGGNPPMRPDQIANLPQTRAGSGPAPQSAFVVAQRVIVFGTGPGRGIFVYSPTPAAGNLKASFTAAAGTDPYGNAYLAGNTSYSASGVTNENGGVTLVYAPTAAAGNLVAGVAPVAGTDSFGNAYVAGVASYGTGGLAGTAVELTSDTITMIPAGVAASGFNLINGSTGAGVIEVLPGVTAADSSLTAAFVSKNESTDTLTPAVELRSAGKFVADVFQPWNPTSSRGSVETWHSLGTLAGYTVTRGRYRLTNQGELALSIEVVGGGAQAGTVTFSNTLPAQYQPVSTHFALPMGTTRQQAAGEVSPRLNVTAAGAVTVINDGANANTFSFSGEITIDD